MKRTLLAITALMLSIGCTKAGAFNGFVNFEALQQTIECVRKPGTDYMVCTNKLAEEEEEDVTPEPESTPVAQDPKYDLYNRDVQELNGLIDMAGCDNPSANHIKFMLDVDLDGDQDTVIGFECITYTQDAQDLMDQLTYDEFYGWIADSYLAVFINHEGEFRNDQSIFDGEYPVYDRTLKNWYAHNVGDINGDGYDDISISHHWDNSIYDSINHSIINNCGVGVKCGFVSSAYLNAGSVMISDGVGGYKAHLLPMQTWQGVPQFYTDELGDTYVWIFTEQNTMWSDMYEEYQKRELDLEIRPYVGKVSGADLIDVTDRYWQRIDNTNSRDRSEYCYIARSMAVNGEYQPHPHYDWQLPCSNPENWLPTNYAVEHLAGKVYLNPSRNIVHNQIYTADERIIHCKAPDFSSDERVWQERQCVLDATTNQPWMFDSLTILAMDSERGVYVQNTHQYPGEFRYYLNDPDVPVSQGGDYETLLYVDMGDHIQINAWGWGLTIAQEDNSGDILALSNMGNILLDPDVMIDDVTELAHYILREFDPQTGMWSNSLESNLSNPRSLLKIMKAGFCPDVLLSIEPEDCLDPDSWVQNMALRYQDLHGDYGRSIGHRVTQDGGVIVTEPKLTNLNMAFNPFKTFLIDFDSDGDLDLYIADNNLDCGPMCLMENQGDYEFEQNLEGIWLQADTEFWDMEYHQTEPQTDTQRLFKVAKGAINITDVDGDGMLDFYALKSRQTWGDDIWDMDTILNIIYAE